MAKRNVNYSSPLEAQAHTVTVDAGLCVEHPSMENGGTDTKSLQGIHHLVPHGNFKLL
jgi:hypothetical protein